MAIVEIKTLEEQAKKDWETVNKKEGLLASAEGQPLSAFFGRDILITSIFLLERHKMRPNSEVFNIIRENLAILAANQGKSFDPETDEEPGKIEHENRLGPANQSRLEELARNFPVKGAKGELYMRYWGSVDATPLFVGVAAEYIKVSNDWKFFWQAKDNLKAAIGWMENYGDIDGDGFIEYCAKNRNALINQGWKDSGDSILTPEGTHPIEPIALVEVQGYTYWALVLAAQLFEKAGEAQFANHLKNRAVLLKEKFNKDFWMENEQFVAFALDGNKKQIKDIVSNVGHLLITGILDKERATLVVKRLMRPDMLTKYGIRTLSSNSVHFKFSETDPEIQKGAYHNGSVWPHDNQIIALGFKKYGFENEARLIKEAVLAAIAQLGNVELYQVDPDGQKLVPYAKAAKPQTWVIGSTLLWTTPEPQIFEKLRRLINPFEVVKKWGNLTGQIFNQ